MGKINRSWLIVPDESVPCFLQKVEKATRKNEFIMKMGAGLAFPFIIL
jgi:hypothetical protein